MDGSFSPVQQGCRGGVKTRQGVCWKYLAHCNYMDLGANWRHHPAIFFQLFSFFFFASHFQPLVRVKNAPSFPKNCSKQEVFSIEQQCCFRICIVIERGQGRKIYHWGHYFLKQRCLLVQQKTMMRMNMLHRLRGKVESHECMD